MAPEKQETKPVLDPDHCRTCKHEWGYHGGDGCQAQVQISGDWYDCNCQKQAPKDLGCTCRPPNPTVIDSLYPQHHAWCAIEKAKEV